ncbi:MAG: ABC transporter permease [Rhodothalassiaceae bacterium]|nr:MAG: ABC transporter permease [Rhodothalassiaceae bacterium]
MTEVRTMRLVPGLAAGLLVAFAVHLGLGILPGLIEGDPVARVIAFEIRLPRALLALLVGWALGASGAALQGYLRNPLAEPAVVGVSASAALAAVAVLYLGSVGIASWSLPLAALTGAIAATGILVVLARAGARALTLILAGVAINALAAAGTALVLNLSPSPFALADMVTWIMGSFAGRSMDDVLLAAPFVLAGLALLLSCGPALAALTLGEETAASLGMPVAKSGVRIVLGTGLAVGAAVAVAGAIGFVGLVVPHLLRARVGHAPDRLLLPSALGGALFLLIGDIGVRLLPTAQPLNIGVLTALIGAPVFLHLIWTSRRWQGGME